MARSRSLFESATSRARVIRQGELVQIVVDGGGSFVTTLQEFIPAQKWAMGRVATENAITDRGRLFERINVLISRPGSTVSTRGPVKFLENLARLMLQGGYDLSEWMLPPELKNMKASAMAAQAEAEAESRSRPPSAGPRDAGSSPPAPGDGEDATGSRGP